MIYKYNYHYVCVKQDSMDFGTLITLPSDNWPEGFWEAHPIWKLFKITENAGSV